MVGSAFHGMIYKGYDCDKASEKTKAKEKMSGNRVGAS